MKETILYILMFALTVFMWSEIFDKAEQIADYEKEISILRCIENPDLMGCGDPNYK